MIVVRRLENCQLGIDPMELVLQIPDVAGVAGLGGAAGAGLRLKLNFLLLLFIIEQE